MCGALWPTPWGGFATHRAADPLIALLKTDSDSRVRGSVAQALGHLGDARAVEPLMAILGDGSLAEILSLRFRRHWRVGGAARHRTADVLMAILTQKGDRSYMEPAQAAWALGRLKDVRIADRLAAIWQDPKQPGPLRVLAAGRSAEHVITKRSRRWPLS